MPLDDEFWSQEDELLLQVVYPVVVETVRQEARTEMERLEAEYDIAIGFDEIDRTVIDWAKRYSYELVKGINQTSRQYIADVMQEFLQQGKPLENIADALDPLYGPVRAEMIAITETTRAFAEADMATWRSSGFVTGKSWAAVASDACDLCLENQAAGVIGIDEAFPSGDDNPPGHPRCRCYPKPHIEVPHG
jgi:hypothetical protein